MALFWLRSGLSIFDFVMKIEGVEFGDALRILAAKSRRSTQTRKCPAKNRAPEAVRNLRLGLARFLKNNYRAAVGKKQKSICYNRGITKDSITKWRVGYSPDLWNGLTDFFIGKGYQRRKW